MSDLMDELKAAAKAELYDRDSVDDLSLLEGHLDGWAAELRSIVDSIDGQREQRAASYREQETAGAPRGALADIEEDNANWWRRAQWVQVTARERLTAIDARRAVDAHQQLRAAVHQARRQLEAGTVDERTARHILRRLDVLDEADPLPHVQRLAAV